MRLPIAYYGDPVLRQRAEEVTEFTDEVKAFIQDMLDTYKALTSTAGLAAPQVHKLWRIFLITPVSVGEDGYYKYEEDSPPEIYVNPVLSEPSEETEILPQGCFSIPGVYGPVERPCAITVEALNEKGETFKKRVEGPMAHAIMHENDHLNGVLFIDRMIPKERRKLEAGLRKVKKELYLKKKK